MAVGDGSPYPHACRGSGETDASSSMFRLPTNDLSSGTACFCFAIKQGFPGMEDSWTASRYLKGSKLFRKRPALYFGADEADRLHENHQRLGAPARLLSGSTARLSRSCRHSRPTSRA